MLNETYQSLSRKKELDNNVQKLSRITSREKYSDV
jgi:hypothetical protein